MTTPTAASLTEHRPSPFAGVDVCEQAGLALPGGARRPLFEDNMWDLSEVVGLAVHIPPSAARFDFAAIGNPRWRLVAKELIMATLAPRHHAVAELSRAYRTPLHLSSSNKRFRELTGFFRWLEQRHVTSLGEVDNRTCEAYLAFRRHVLDENGIVVGELSPMMRRSIAQVVIDLINHRDLFTADRVHADLRPWGGAAAASVAELTRVRGANSTPPVPDELFRPTLAAALHLVQVLGPHAVALNEQVREHDRLYGTKTVELRPFTQAPVEDILTVLDHYALTGAPLPRQEDHIIAKRLAAGWSAEDPLLPIATGMLARQAGRGEFELRWMPHLRGPLTEAVAALGVEKIFARDATHALTADGTSVPWSLPLHRSQAVAVVGVIRTAAITVLAASSGMRGSELMELRVGCRRPIEEPVPGLKRYRIASKVVKGRPLGGVDDEWVVIEPAFRAVELIEQLHDNPHDGAALLSRFSFKCRDVLFRAWVNSPSGQRMGLAPIPDGPFTVSMIRRTVALELAYRPGGVLAAKLQLKHIATATTEGYAARPGGAQAELLAEVNKHEAERNLQLVLTEFHNYRNGILPAGPGARDLIDFFTSIDTDAHTEAAAAPKIQRNDRDILNLLSKRAKTLHLGTANYCWLCEISHNQHYAEHRVMRTRTTIALGQNMIAGWSVGIIWDVRDLLHDPPSGCSM